MMPYKQLSLADIFTVCQNKFDNNQYASHSLLAFFLKHSQKLRNFCGFDVVPDASKFTRFKQDFSWDLHSMFDWLAGRTDMPAH